MTAEKEPLPAMIPTAMTAPAGPGHVLPAGVVRYGKPLTRHDYIIANPLDQRAVDEILHKVVCNTRQTMEPGARLYVVMGEEHSTPVHLITQAGLLDNLAASPREDGAPQGAILYASETPYNNLQAYAREYADNYNPGEAIYARLPEHDRLGHHFARAAQGPLGISNAPLSARLIFRRCLKNNIPLALVDAACDEETDEYLCPSDELACAVTRDLPPPYDGLDLAQDSIKARDNNGIFIRNAVMAKRITAAAEKQQADTIVVGTGFLHLGGGGEEFCPYDTSLTALLKNEIRPQDTILPVFFSLKEKGYRAEHYLPPSFRLHNPQAVIIRNASERSYDTGNDNNILSILYKAWRENRFIRRLGQSYSRAAQPVPARFKTAGFRNQDTIRKELQELIGQIDRATAPHPF